MKYLILVLFSLNIFALEINDRLSEVSVIKHYKGNIVVLNRGLEDAINKFDHIKLTNSNGYIARAICIKASMMLSYWKVYRVVNPELLSYDNTYTLKSMLQSELPPHISEYIDSRLEKSYLANVGEDGRNDYFDNKIKDEDLGKQVKLQQTRIVEYDLGNDVLDDKVFKEKEDETSAFLIKNFDSKQLKKDLSNINARIFTSPISWQSQNDQKSINYGLQISNFGEKYEFDFQYNKRESKIVDQLSDTEVTSNSTFASISFDINYITESLSYFMFSSYNQAKQGELFYPRRQFQGGVFGLKYHILDNSAGTKFDISYITLIDYLEFDSQTFNEDTFELETDIETIRSARHSFRIRLKSNISENATFNSILWYKPLINLDTQEIDFDNTMTDWRTSLSWRLTESLSASYEFTYTYDVNLEREFDLEPMNQINTINVSYSFTM
jgi:hypothetical protein